MTTCENCGSNTYRGACVTCDEEIYIEQQYAHEGLEIPENISRAAGEQRKRITERTAEPKE
jgi:hypothetical protein